MNFRIVFVLICISLVGASFIGSSSEEKSKPTSAEPRSISINDPYSVKMAFYINKYAEKYQIPLRYAYGIAYEETRYMGPSHFNYNPSQTSSVGAVGPMQVMPYVGKSLLNCLDRKTEADTMSIKRLKTDIELNVELSMYLLRRLYDRHRDWKLVFGAYNTGSPVINNYAINVYNFDYSKHLEI